MTDAGTEGVLLQAVRDVLRTAFSLTEADCQVTADGRPDPACGQVFLAVHPGTSDNAARNYLDERVSFFVTITYRTGYTPQDRIGEAVLIDPQAGLLRFASRVKAALHMQYDVLAAANALIDGFDDTTNGFVEPPGYRSAVYLGPQGANWFWGEGVADDTTGLAVQLTFDGARRICATDVDT